MLYYSATATILIGFVSMLLVYTLRRLELPSCRVVITTSIGSVVVSLLFPVIYKLVSSAETTTGNNITLINALSISAVGSLVLIFIICVTASIIIPDSTFELFLSKFRRKSEDLTAISQADHGNVAPIFEPLQSNSNYLAEIFENSITEKQKDMVDIGDNTRKAENNLEISVDSEENTDKMGIETFEQDKMVFLEGTSSELQADDLNIGQCIDEAFRFKESGDLEGAILYFMYALDKKPGKDLVFWIVLDVCVLYKELNQVELAKDILTGYMENYRDFMPVAVRDEIESNLLYI